MPTLTTTAPCDCCNTDTESQYCWKHIEVGDPVPIGTPACYSNWSQCTALQYYFTAPESSNLDAEVRATIGICIEVDCSEEESGYCRGLGASGTYSFGSTVYIDTQFSGPVSEVGTFASLNYEFEDCFGLGSRDLLIQVLVERVETPPGPDGCYLLLFEEGGGGGGII